MSLHKEWATFIDPRDASTWQIDLTFLASTWHCIFGSGCKGIHGDAAVGCCSSGVFIKAHDEDEEGEEDFQLVKKRVKQLTDEDWDLRPKYRKNWWKEREKGSGSKHTRLHDGACVFANRNGASGTIGCAFHVAALKRGEDPIDWKPWVCGLVPFALDHDDDEEHHTLRAYEHERDWGSGDGEPLDWWCVDAPEAYSGSQPVYRAEESLLRRILGDELFEEVAAYLDSRTPASAGSTPVNWVGHWGVEPPDGTTSIPLPMAPVRRAKP